MTIPDATIMKNSFKPPPKNGQMGVGVDQRELELRKATGKKCRHIKSKNYTLLMTCNKTSTFLLSSLIIDFGSRKLEEPNKYTGDRLDYDTNCDDYNYPDEELPVLRRKMRRPKLRCSTKTPCHSGPLPRGDHFQPQSTPLPPIPQQPSPLPLVAPPTQANTPQVPVGILPPHIPLPVPLTPAPPFQMIQMEESTPETCQQMLRLATAFGIADISSYARECCFF
ncbi:unnamed protein product [Cylicocyclus nassatus]|uniref:aECM cysteine-cradle domain-containing protein n=1 Tax=Cylicocyclus nassatus TaxID=53992 RepID=A0AA36H102_CYLNA|nr:unnamed protein product [Cylicocyclus nassatus]